VIDDSSINLIFTSPEYPLVKPKQYGKASLTALERGKPPNIM
jgi:hypothetical protein